MPNSQNRVDKNALPFIIIVVLILGILLGYLSTTILNSAGNLSKNSTVNLGGGISSSTYFDSSYLDGIYKTLNESYLGNIPSKTEVTEGMVKGIISSLNDPYTTYLTPEEATAYNSSKDPDFQGIGVSLKLEDGNTVVETVLEGNPAQSAGIKVGDIIAEVDGTDVLGQTPTVVASKIRGEKDTTVAIKVYRENELKEFSIKRAKIDVDNVNYKNLGNGYFRINIYQFTDSTAEALNASWDKVVSEIVKEDPNPKGIVVDLRNNPGGYVYSLRHMLEEFFKSGTVLMKEEKKNSEEMVYKDERVGRFENIKVTVIVNEGSASASEIFAAAIQDNNRGKVIGQKTVGKGVEQTLIQGNDGSMLILVFQKWLRPNGEQISKDKPIAPDELVELNEEAAKSGKDTQLDRALELVK